MGENMVSNCIIDAVTGSAARTMDKRASHRPIGRRRLARYSQIRMTRMTSANLLGEQAEQAAMCDDLTDQRIDFVSAGV